MSWLKLSDDFPNHPKVLTLDDAAFRLHVTALCYCARSGTEGFVSAKVAPRLRLDADELIPHLIDAGLWEPCDGGWMIHDYLQYNLSNARVAEIKALRAKAGRRGGLAPAKQIANPVPRTPSPVLPSSQEPVLAKQVAKQVAKQEGDDGSLKKDVTSGFPPFDERWAP